MIYIAAILSFIISRSSDALDCLEFAKKIAIEDISISEKKRQLETYSKTSKQDNTGFYQANQKLQKEPLKISIGQTSKFIPVHVLPTFDTKKESATYQFEVSLNDKHTDVTCYSVTVRQRHCAKIKSNPISCDE